MLVHWIKQEFAGSVSDVEGGRLGVADSMELCCVS